VVSNANPGAFLTTAAALTAFSAAGTAHARWSANTFTVTYVAGGGSGNQTGSPQSCTFGETCIALNSTFTPPTGRSFGGWSCGGGLNTICSGHVFQPGTNISHVSHGTPVTMTAVWDANCVTVTLAPNGGTGGTPSPVHQVFQEGWFSGGCHNQWIETITANPTRPGHIFQGYWTTSAATGGTQIISNAHPGAFLVNDHFTSGTGTVHARWTQCNPGHVSADSRECTPCAPGNHSNHNQSACIPCEVGYHQPNPAEPQCIPCPPNHTSGTGATNCTRTHINFINVPDRAGRLSIGPDTTPFTPIPLRI
jgi:hypothetical protein